MGISNAYTWVWVLILGVFLVTSIVILLVCIFRKLITLRKANLFWREKVQYSSLETEDSDSDENNVEINVNDDQKRLKELISLCDDIGEVEGVDPLELDEISSMNIATSKPDPYSLREEIKDQVNVAAPILTIDNGPEIEGPAMLHVVYNSDGYVAGNIMAISNLPKVQDGGPLLVKIHVKILPRGKYAVKTLWNKVVNGRADFNEVYTYNLKRSDGNLEKSARFRVYGTGNTLSDASSKYIVGSHQYDIDTEKVGDRGMKFWVPLLSEAE